VLRGSVNLLARKPAASVLAILDTYKITASRYVPR